MKKPKFNADTGYVGGKGRGLTTPKDGEGMSGILAGQTPAEIIVSFSGGPTAEQWRTLSLYIDNYLKTIGAQR